jgi:hypothetical protein
MTSNSQQRAQVLSTWSLSAAEEASRHLMTSNVPIARQYRASNKLPVLTKAEWDRQHLANKKAATNTTSRTTPSAPTAEQLRKAAHLQERLSALEAATSARMRALAKQDQTKQQEQARAARVQAEHREDELAKLDRAMGIEPAGGVRMEGFTQVFAMEHKPPHVDRKTRSVFWPFDADSEQHEGKKEVLKNQLATDEPVGGTSGTAPGALVYSFDGTTRRITW